MFKPKWRKVICFDALNKSQVYWLWGTKREVRQYVREMRKRDKCADAYII
jgi:hypothetical protein